MPIDFVNMLSPVAVAIDVLCVRGFVKSLSVVTNDVLAPEFKIGLTGLVLVLY